MYDVIFQIWYRISYLEFHTSSNPLFFFYDFFNCTVSLMEGCNIIRLYLLSKCQISVMIKRKQPILSQNLLFIKDRLQYKTNGFYYLFSLCDHHFIFTRWISVGGRQLAINGHAVCNTHSLLLLIMIPSSSTLKMVIELDDFCTCFYLHRIAKFIKKRICQTFQ